MLAIDQDDEAGERIFLLETRTNLGVRRFRKARVVVLAMGYYDEPNLLGITGEDLVSLIKMNVAEDTWEHVASQIAFSDGVLTVTNRKSVHDKIAQYLNYWRGFLGKMISIDAAIVSVDPQLLARIRSAGDADRPAILPPAHFSKLLEAAREGKFPVKAPGDKESKARDELPPGIDQLVQFNIEAVECRYTDDLGAYWKKLPDPSDHPVFRLEK